MQSSRKCSATRIGKPKEKGENVGRLPDEIPEKVHMIAVCGTGMGALACMLRDLGFEVTGSDQKVYPPMSTFLALHHVSVLVSDTQRALAFYRDLLGLSLDRTEGELGLLSEGAPGPAAVAARPRRSDRGTAKPVWAQAGRVVERMQPGHRRRAASCRRW